MPPQEENEYSNELYCASLAIDLELPDARLF